MDGPPTDRTVRFVLKLSEVTLRVTCGIMFMPVGVSGPIPPASQRIVTDQGQPQFDGRHHQVENCGKEDMGDGPGEGEEGVHPDQVNWPLEDRDGVEESYQQECKGPKDNGPPEQVEPEPDQYPCDSQEQKGNECSSFSAIQARYSSITTIYFLTFP